jgi:hypothetical protein
MNTKKSMEKWTMAAAAALIVALFAVAAFAQSNASFRFFGPLSRVITPNGNTQKNNGTAFFCFDNPADSGVTGNMFSLLGSAVASMGPVNMNVYPGGYGSGCPAGSLPNSGQSMTWDGTSNGTVVHSGVYVYRITAEQRSYTGTIIVVR